MISEHLLPFTHQHQAPEFCSGAFSVILILRNSSVPAIAGCRLTTGYLAVRISDPVARPSGPLNSQLPATMPPGPARGRPRSTSELVVRGRAVASLTTRRKVSRSRGDSGKDRPRHHAEAARVHAAEILIRAQRPPAAPSVNISLRVLAYGAVSATGW